MSRTREPVRRRLQQRNLARLLLAVYALFLLAPGIHLLGHEHESPGGHSTVAHSDEHSPRTLAPDCGHGCENPFHDHHEHLSDSACAVCQVLGSWTPCLDAAPRLDERPAPRSGVAARAPPVRCAPELRVPGARAPPPSTAA